MHVAIAHEALAGVAGLFGLVIGSFLNVVIYRLPREESLAFPGSHCTVCGATVRWWDNIPLLSYLLLRGRCRACGTAISLRYPAIELLTALLFAAIAWVHGWQPMLPVWCAFAAALVATAAIDFDHQIIPDEISLGGLLLALVLVPAAAAFAGGDFVAALRNSAVGAALGGGVLWVVGFAHARLSSALGRTFEHWPGEGESLPVPASVDYWVWFPGVGFGDVKLLGLIGAVVGPLGVLLTIVAASVAGLVLGLGFAAVTRRFSAPIGFGPALAAGALFVVLAPDMLEL